MSPFSEPVNNILSTDKSAVKDDPKNHTPLLIQEEIDDELPPKINMTAVICTAIVAVCATIIICVARPWSSDSEEVTAQVVVSETEVVASDANSKQETSEAKPAETKPAEAKPTETKPAETKQAEAKPAETKQVEAKPAETKPAEAKPAGLPIVPVTTTGTANPYNKVRLIDASSRKLTKAEVEQMNKTELALARNAIYARHGYVYKNSELGEFFSKQPWFKPNKALKLEDVKPLFSDIEVANINLILAQEKK